MRRTFEKFGYRPLETPALYRAEAVAPGYGTGIQGLMCTLRDDSGQELTLAYDLTVPLARYVAANAKRLSLPFKRYQVQSVWRPLSGRPGHFREFHRCDVDIIGSAHLACDAEICRVVADTLSALELEPFVICYNLADPAQVDTAEFLSCCERLGLAKERLRRDSGLVRDLGYYTGLVFAVELVGKESPVCVGGRYTIALSGQRVTGVGVSFDLDRIVTELAHRKRERHTSVNVLVMSHPQREKQTLELYRELLDSDVSASCYFEAVSLSRQLSYAREQHIPFAAVPNPDVGNVTLIHVPTGRRKSIPRGQVAEYLRGFYDT